MASEFPINSIIQFAQVSQYLSANDRNNLLYLQSGQYIGNLPQLLYMEGTLLQNLNSLNSGSSTLRGTAEYVLSLCGKYLTQAQTIINNLAGSRPVITGPSNQSTTVGGSVTFSVSVTGSAPFTYQWLIGGIPIPGATSSSLVISNVQLAQSGNLYSVAVTNPVTTVTSNQVTLTVTASEVGYYCQSNTDYSTDLLAGNDVVPWQGTFNITTGQPLVVTFPTPGAGEYIYVKYPSSETTKVLATNPPGGLDQVAIPSIAFENIATITTWKYIFSRTGNPYALNNVNGSVAFS